MTCGIVRILIGSTNNPQVNYVITASRSIFFAARRALSHHATGGNVLMCATVLALIVANIPGLNTIYNDFWTQEMRLQIGSFNVLSHAGHPMTVIQFINDALMAIFFFNIGLEIKREVPCGRTLVIPSGSAPNHGGNRRNGAASRDILAHVARHRLCRRRGHPHGHRHWPSRSASSPCSAAVCLSRSRFSSPPSPWSTTSEASSS